MATYIGTGFSNKNNASEAAQEAAFQARVQTKQHFINLAFVFTTIHYSPLETLNAVRQTLNHPDLIGCSTAGIILAESTELRGIGVIAIASDEITFTLSSVNDIAPEHMRLAGEHLARSAANDFGAHQRATMFLFSDGLQKNNSDLISGAQSVMGNAFPIVGAGSIDDFRFRQTFQYYQDQPLTRSAVALLMGGKMHVSIGSYHGWKPLGKPRIIDEAEGSVIKKIDGKAAALIYREYFGDDARLLQAKKLARMTILYPLGIYIEQDKDYLIRNIVEIRDDGCIVCQGDVPRGGEVHLMIGNEDFCKEAAAEAAKAVFETLNKKQPKLVIIFESLARQKLLGRGAIQEVHEIRKILGSGVPLLGIYTYGQIAPFHSLKHIGKSFWQNEAITIVAIE